MSLKKVRGKKTSHEQKEYLVGMFESNSILVSGKCHPSRTNEVDKLWDTLVENLNEISNGARKDKQQWKTYLTEWKSKIKKKIRDKKKDLIQTGGGGYRSEDLTDVENRLMNVIGWTATIGNPNIVELDPDSLQIAEKYEVVEMQNNLEVLEFGDTGENSTEQVTFPEGSAILTQKPIEVSGSSNKTYRRKPYQKRNYEGQSTKLEKSAEIYLKSATNMAEAMNNMADSITKFADALVILADSITKSREQPPKC